MGGFPVLADAISAIENFVHVFIIVYILLIFGYIITSWVRLPYSPWLNRIQRFLYDVCEPYLRLFRRILPPLGPLDLVGEIRSGAPDVLEALGHLFHELVDGATAVAKQATAQANVSDFNG